MTFLGSLRPIITEYNDAQTRKLELAGNVIELDAFSVLLKYYLSPPISIEIFRLFVFSLKNNACC